MMKDALAHLLLGLARWIAPDTRGQSGTPTSSSTPWADTREQQQDLLAIVAILHQHPEWRFLVYPVMGEPRLTPDLVEVVVALLLQPHRIRRARHALDMTRHEMSSPPIREREW
jgi:hypothetical protein